MISSMLEPASRFSKTVATGIRVSRNTQAPLRLSGTLSTAGQFDQSRLAMLELLLSGYAKTTEKLPPWQFQRARAPKASTTVQRVPCHHRRQRDHHTRQPNRRPRGRAIRWRPLLQAVQPVIVPIEPLLVDLGYVQQTRNALHDFAQAPVALSVFRGKLSVFRGKLFVCLRHVLSRLAVLGHHQFHALGEGLVTLGQPLQSLV